MDNVAIFSEKPLVVSHEIGINFAVAPDEWESSCRPWDRSNLV